MAVGALALGAGLLVGVSEAEPPSVDVEFTPLTPVRKVLGNTKINVNATKLVTVSGGSTTVPTNATTIELDVTAGGASAGTLSVYPAGNPGGSSGQTVSWTAGGTGNATIRTDIGQKNQVAFLNASGAKVSVTAYITGYSTEVGAADISSIGGSTGQVLTDTGSGAAWAAPQLPAAYFARNSSYVALTGTPATVVSLAVPAGTYAVSAATTAFGNVATGYFYCDLQGPATGLAARRWGNVTAGTNSTLAFDGLVQTVGGSITIRCSLISGGADMYENTIMATRVGQTSGPVVTRPTPPGRIHQPGR